MATTDRMQRLPASTVPSRLTLGAALVALAGVGLVGYGIVFLIHNFTGFYRAWPELSARWWHPTADQGLQPRPLRVHQPPARGRLRVTHRARGRGDRLGMVWEPPGATLGVVDSVV